MTDHAPADLTGFDAAALDAIVYRLSREIEAHRAAIATKEAELARVRRARDGKLKRAV